MIGGLLISAALDACESHGGAANFPAGCKEGIMRGAVLRFPSRKGAGSGARGGASLDWLVELERQEDWPGARRRTSTHPSGAFIHIGYIVVTASEMRSLVAVS